VHKLRRGDIDVVGAMGDSITAGNGAASLHMMQAYVENMGLSFATRPSRN
jgi:phospholipase B1